MKKLYFIMPWVFCVVTFVVTLPAQVIVLLITVVPAIADKLLGRFDYDIAIERVALYQGALTKVLHLMVPTQTLAIIFSWMYINYDKKVFTFKEYWLYSYNNYPFQELIDY